MEVECNMSQILQFIGKDLVSYYKYVQGHKEIECDDYINYKKIKLQLENKNYSS